MASRGEKLIVFEFIGDMDTLKRANEDTLATEGDIAEIGEDVRLLENYLDKVERLQTYVRRRANRHQYSSQSLSLSLPSLAEYI